MKNLKVKRTLVQDKEETVYISPVTYKTADGCRIKMESVLEEEYGDDWQMLHGCDFDTDKNGMPHYQFDMGGGDYEEMEVIEV